jgi:CTP:molybdopterin cytidylyltransferase MocA
MKVAAIIPAAGQGERFGMPKVDAQYNGISFAQRIINTLQEAGLAEYVLVRDVKTDDMLGSIKWGMEQYLASNARPDGWLIWPVDHPVVTATTITILTTIFADKQNSVIIPRCQGSNGHPILVPGSLVIPDKPQPLGLKGVILESGFSMRYVNVNDVGVLFNINTTDDVVYV